MDFNLKQLIERKRKWSEPLRPEDIAKGFKGGIPAWEEDYFDRYIRDETHFGRVVRYIENNPVKAGLVKTKEEWLWSSARYRSRVDLSARTLTHPSAQRVPSPPV